MYIAFYLLAGLVLAEITRQHKPNKTRKPGTRIAAYLLTLLLWPPFFIVSCMAVALYFYRRRGQ